MIIFGVILSLLIIVDVETTSNKRIIGGKTTSINQYNHHVAINADGTYICGGSIISERHILTAAHCYRLYTTYTVRYGSSFHDDFGTLVYVTHFYLHPYYYMVTASNGNEYPKNDIAIFKLKDVIKFGNHANKIDLPEPNYEPTVGFSATLTGWGNEYFAPTNQLKRAYLPIMRNVDCAKIWIPVNVYDTNICASVNAEDSACTGDSGGGLVLNGKVIGIASWTIENCATGTSSKPNVFARVSKYFWWIQEQLKK
ncbi:trypsin 3A1-like [Onthophagus taurus]|uniref:trypsin 3A1-like n=1 Tax=Onthophagus taurus TaxID=166361 RepID=UPI0039BDDDB5